MVELVVLYSSVFMGVDIRFLDLTGPESTLFLEPLEPKAAAFAIMLSISMTAVGLHTRNVADDFAGMMIRIALSFALGFIGNTLLFYIYPALYLGRGVLALSLLIAFFGILITRTFYQKLDAHIFTSRVLILGTGKNARLLESMEEEASSRGQRIIAYVEADNDDSENLVSSEKIQKIKTTLLDLVGELAIDEIVVAIDDRRNHFPSNELLDCKMHGVIIRDPVEFLERIKGHIELEALNPSMLIFSSGFSQAEMGKRLFDIIVSLTILVITSPIFLLTAVLIWLSTFGRDPVFYRQRRLGLGDIPFDVLKFRSMKVDAEKNGAQFAQKNDSRVTLIGRIIRKTRIDELPQLINVLKGEMSFVGPRPERPEFVSEFEHDIPHYSLRHAVKPGITGWAQICYPYGDTLEDARKKLQFDLYYIKNYSIFLDLTILFQTAQVILFGKGAR
jgi:sugar transferase (PEP-CTERM system associated)